ncbi:MAG: type II secretion system GspH family protein [Cyanobacteria bacterium]|nr:type II secretion system GspH family protein [Cyanobacteriota bacterium]
MPSQGLNTKATLLGNKIWSRHVIYKTVFAAFTIAELLISLAILGVIAVFTIPKLVSLNEDRKRAAIVKEVASMVSGAYQSYRLKATPSASTSGLDLLPFLNYRSATPMVSYSGPLTGPGVFIDLHNGALINISGGGASGGSQPNAVSFGGTTAKDYLLIEVYPSGHYEGNPELNKVCFVLTYPGRLNTVPTYIQEQGGPDGLLSTVVGTPSGSYYPCLATDPAYIQNWQ